jgi:hypothetical protein
VHETVASAIKAEKFRKLEDENDELIKNAGRWVPGEITGSQLFLLWVLVNTARRTSSCASGISQY